MDTVVAAEAAPLTPNARAAGVPGSARKGAVPGTPGSAVKGTPAKRNPGTPHTANKKEYSRRARERAYALIQKHAPGYIAEAQNSDWVMRLVMSIDASYWKKLEAEAHRADTLRKELEAVRLEAADPLQHALSEINALKTRTRIAEEKCAGYEAAFLQAQDEIAGLRQGLELAEATAAAATAECASLQTLADKWSRSRERARISIARRASDLKDRLTDTRSRLRNSQSLARKQHFALQKADKDREEMKDAKERSDGRAADVQRLYERESTLLRSQVGLMQERLENALAPQRKAGAPPWRVQKSKVDVPPPSYAAWVPAGVAPPHVPPATMSPRRSGNEESAVYAGQLRAAGPATDFPHTARGAWPATEPSAASPAKSPARRTPRKGGVLDEVIRDRDLESAAMRAEALAEAAQNKAAEVRAIRRRI